MKYMMIIYLSFILCCGTIASAANPDEQQKAARESLRLLKKLPLPYIKKLGFKSGRMVKNSLLGNPLEVYIIGIDSLEMYEANRDPKEVLEDTSQVGYPVYVSEMPVSSITIIERNRKWEFAVFGGKEILFAEQARLKHSGSGPGPRPSYFMVQVQAMYITFLAFNLDGVLYFIPTAEHPLLKFPLYVPVPASKVLMELKGIVEKYENGLSVHYATDKDPLQPGDTTTLTITFSGLDRDKGDLLFILKNKTPEIISMEGGNTQYLLIRAKAVKPDGTCILTRTLTGKVLGKSGIEIKPYLLIKQLAERLGSNRGMEYRNKLANPQEKKIPDIPKSRYISFTKKDLNIYKTGKDPSTAPQMKAWASIILSFLSKVNPEAQQWLADIYMKSLIEALSK